MSDQAKVEDSASLLEFAQLLALMSRLITRVSALPQLREVDLGLAEWIALSLLQEKDGISNKELAKRVGVSGQRANQVISSLESANLLTVSQSTEDSRKNVIRLTELGRSRLALVNSKLLPLIAEINLKRPRLLVGAIRSMLLITRTLQSEPKPVKEN